MATRKKKNNIGAFGHPIYGKGFAKYGEMQPNVSSETPNDLEEASQEYEKKHTHQRYDGGGFTPEYDATLAEAVIFGAEWQKEHMLKDAVEVRVQPSPLNGPLGISAYCCNFPSKHPFYRCKEGDKVKLIIVKED